MTTNHREKSNHTRDIRFFSCGSHVCRHSSPRCVNQHLVVLWLIGITPNQQMVSHTLVHSSSRRERTMVDALLTSWSLVFPFHAASTFGMLRPTFVRHYKMPLAFALLRHPHPLESEAQLRDPVVIQGTRFVSQRWLCNLRRRRYLVFIEEVQVYHWLVSLRVHDVWVLSLLFLDLLGIRHVLDNHFLIVPPLSSSILTSRLSLGCIRLLLIVYL